MEDNLSFDFSFDVVGRIWQLRADQDNAQVALEIRDEAEQSVSFLIFDLKSLEISDYYDIEEVDWWTTLSGFVNGILTMIRYEDQQDISQKTVLRFHVGEQKLLSVADNEGLLSSGNLDDLGMNNLRSPLFCPQGTETFELCQEYLNQEIQLGVEYFEQGADIVFSYYIRSGAKFDRYIVINRNGKEVCHLCQDSDLDGYAAGSFFILGKYLIFIKDSKQVNGVKI